MLEQSIVKENIRTIKFWLQRQNGFRKAQQIEFIEQLNSYLADDIGLVEALESTRKQYVAIYDDRHVSVQVAQNLQDAAIVGVGMDKLLEQYFDPVIALSFELAKRVSGDKSGVLNIVELLKEEARIKKGAFAKLFLPSVILIFGIASQFGTAGYLIPMVANELPSTYEAQIAGAIYNFISTKWWIGIGVLSFILWIILYGQRNWRQDGKFGKNRKSLEDVLGDNQLTNFATENLGRLRAKLDRTWPFNLFREFWSVRVLRLLGYMKLADMEDIDALKIIHEYSPPSIQYFLEQMIKGTGIGTAKNEYFAKGLISSPIMVRLQRYFINVDNETFARGLINVSLKAEKVIEVQSNTAISRYWILMLSTGFFLAVFSISAIMQAFTEKFL